MIQSTRVTDRQTDGRTDGIAVAYIRAIAYYATALVKTVENKPAILSEISA